MNDLARRILLFVSLLAPAWAPAADPAPRPAHGRPYFMPEARRAEILQTIEREPWARAEYDRVVKQVEAAHAQLAKPGFAPNAEDGWWAAFLYALEGRQEGLAVARAWLLRAYADDEYHMLRKRAALANADFWTGSEQGVDWYRLDIDGYVGFDWIHSGLSDEDRSLLHANLRLQTLYRMACMDHWGSTPNLNFKPIFMVAFAAMTLQDEDLLEWGWRRTERQGGFFQMMDRMLKDGGVWHEAAIYSVVHRGLWCVEAMAFYRGLCEGTSWFDARTPGGASPRGMIDYFIDSAYALERTGVPPGRIRVSTYGDGATSPDAPGGRDMFIGGVCPDSEKGWLDAMKDGLVLAYAASRDARYAPFIALYPDYAPNLWDRPPLPEDRPFPAAPSTVWPEFGLAMLRSDESAGYWTNLNAIAAFQIMTKYYNAHEHPDKFHLSLFGANRLLYPDYLRIQYENLAMAWTRTSASHNTMIVDDLDTRAAEPSVRHAFTPEVKFLSTSAYGVFPGVAQTRALFLTPEYLLDLFHGGCKTPRTFDYVLNSMGLPEPVAPLRGEADGIVSPKYWPIDNPRQTATDAPWSMDFVIRETPLDPLPAGLGPEWYQHVARVRVTMAADAPTRIGYGHWGDGAYVDRAREVYQADHPRDQGPKLGILIARREARRGTTFAVAHEPYANDQAPGIRTVTMLAESDDACFVRVEAGDFSDYVAVAWGPDADARPHVLVSAHGERVHFQGYGWLRVPTKGTPFGRGGWQGLRIAAGGDRMVLDGTAVAVSFADGWMRYGDLPDAPEPAAVPVAGGAFGVGIEPPLSRLPREGARSVALTLRNTGADTVQGHVEFDLESGILVEPERAAFGPVVPGAATRIDATLSAGRAAEGLAIVPFRVVFRGRTEGDLVTAYQPMNVLVSRWAAPDFSTRYVSQRFEGAELSARFEASGLVTYLADADGAVRLDGEPLYTLHDEKDVEHFGEQTPVVPSVWFGLEVAAASSYRIQGPRMQMRFLEDRIGDIRFDRRYTVQAAYRFTVPGRWRSPAGAPRWARVVAVDGDGREGEAAPGVDAPIAALELAFPDATRHIAFAFDPPRRVNVEGLRLEFVLQRPLPGDVGPRWSVGFCRPGELDAWRARPAPGEPLREWPVLP